MLNGPESLLKIHLNQICNWKWFITILDTAFILPYKLGIHVPVKFWKCYSLPGLAVYFCRILSTEKFFFQYFWPAVSISRNTYIEVLQVIQNYGRTWQIKLSCLLFPFHANVNKIGYKDFNHIYSNK